MINTATLKFLQSLKKNNNRDWFEKNKELYLAAKEDVSSLIDNLLGEITRFDKRFADLTAKDCLFRIYRDVRFSHDKSPYKINMGAGISIGGKKSTGAGYYLHIEPGKSFLAGGIWMPPGDQLKKIRQEIDYNGPKLKKILEAKAFKSYYGGLDPEYTLKTNPRGYAKDHPFIDYIRFNSYIVVHDFSDKEVLSKSFVKDLAKGAKLMKPFLDFLNEGLD